MSDDAVVRIDFHDSEPNKGSEDAKNAAKEIKEAVDYFIRQMGNQFAVGQPFKQSSGASGRLRAFGANIAGAGGDESQGEMLDVFKTRAEAEEYIRKLRAEDEKKKQSSAVIPPYVQPEIARVDVPSNNEFEKWAELNNEKYKNLLNFGESTGVNYYRSKSGNYNTTNPDGSEDFESWTESNNEKYKNLLNFGVPTGVNYYRSKSGNYDTTNPDGSPDGYSHLEKTTKLVKYLNTSLRQSEGLGGGAPPTIFSPNQQWFEDPNDKSQRRSAKLDIDRYKQPEIQKIEEVNQDYLNALKKYYDNLKKQTEKDLLKYIEEQFNPSNEEFILEVEREKTLEEKIAEAVEKRRERERFNAQVNQAYGEKYEGGELKETKNQFMEIASMLRGSIGGVLGPIVGAGLDIAGNQQRISKEAAKRKKEDELLKEAGQPGNAIPVDEMSDLASSAGGIPGVGLIIAAAKAVDEAVKGAIKGTIQGVGSVATGVASASSDPSDPIYALGESASKASEYLGVFGDATLVAGESAKVFASMMKNLDQLANRYGEYSPEISQAQAIAEIRQTFGDFSRSQQVSEELSRYILAQSELQQKFENAKMAMLTKILPLITSTLEVLNLIMSSGESAYKAIETLAIPLTVLATAAGELLGILNRSKDDDLLKDPTTQILKDNKFFMHEGQGGWVPNT